MAAAANARVASRNAIRPLAHYLLKPVRFARSYERSSLRPDLVAGLTVAVILLPQAIAFTLVAGLPPVMGLYAAVIGSIVGALWGSSNQAHTGPANANSLLVLSTLSSIYVVGSPEFVLAAGLLAVLAGIIQLALALLRLGLVVNFVSYSVIVGFAGGAGVLIVLMQLDTLLGLEIEAELLSDKLVQVATGLPDSHPATALIGIGVIALMVILHKFAPKLPGALLSMAAAWWVVFLLDLESKGVRVIGRLPGGLPPLADLPFLDAGLIGDLIPGAIALGAIGLVQAMAIGRSIATETNQHLESNQEFFGQGLANVLAGLFSGYPVSASFSRSAVNHKVGARSPLASVISGLCVVFVMLFLGSLTVYLPRTALSGVLIVTGIGMVNFAEIRRILTGSRGDALIMLVTFFGTLFLHIEIAVLLGITLSLVVYLVRTSTPRVHLVVPDEGYRHFVYDPSRPVCPQLGVIEILGDLYFGAVGHVEEAVHALYEKHPGQRFLLIRMSRVNTCDFSGIHMLEGVVRSYRERGGDVYMVRVGYRVMRVMRNTGFLNYLGEDHILPEDKAISQLFYHKLDPAVCIYECKFRVFMECQNLPKHEFDLELPMYRGLPDIAVEVIKPEELWRDLKGLNGASAPRVIDVREPREFQQGHVPGAELVPLQKLLRDAGSLGTSEKYILVCRSGRRSELAARLLATRGCTGVKILEGGILAWEAARLLEAVD